MKKIMTTIVLSILFHAAVFAQCICYTVEDLSIEQEGFMNLVLSNACDNNVYLNLYVISSTPPYDTLGIQESFAAFILPLNTNVANLLTTELTTLPSMENYRVAISNGTLNCDSLKFSPTLNTTNLSTDRFQSIRPNPFSTQTTIQFDQNLHNATLRIFDTTGRQVSSLKNIVGSQITLDRQALVDGVYFITLTQDDQLIATDKLIIRK